MPSSITTHDQLPNLGVMSSFSSGESISRIGDLCRSATRLGHRALGLCDVMTFEGVADFVDHCQRNDLKPMVGLRIRLAPFPTEGFVWRLSQLPVLVKNEKGWRRLNALLNQARDQETDDSPAHLTYDQILAEPAGLHYILGGEGSEIVRLLDSGMVEEAEQVIESVCEKVPSGHVSIALVSPTNDKQTEICEALILLAEKFELKTVLLPSVRCTLPEDDPAYLIWKKRSRVEEPSAETLGKYLRPRFEREHLRSMDESQELFLHYPDAMINTAALANSISFQPGAPETVFPKGEFGRGVDADSFVWNESFSEAQSRYQDLPFPWRERLNQEFEIFRDKGLPNGFVWMLKLLAEFDEAQIFYGPGLDDLSSSLICSLLSITRVDPFQLGTPPLSEEQVSTELTIRIAPSHFNHAQKILNQHFSQFCFQVSQTKRMTEKEALELASNKLGLSNEIQSKITTTRNFDVFSTRERLTPSGQDPEEEWRFNDPRTLAWLSRRLIDLPKESTPLEGVWGVGEKLKNIPMAKENGDSTRRCVWSKENLARLGYGMIRLESDPTLDVLAHATYWIQMEGRDDFTPESLLQNKADAIWEALGTDAVRNIPILGAPGLRPELRRNTPKTLSELLALVTAWHEANSLTPSPSLVEELLISVLCLGVKQFYPVPYYAAALTASRDDAGAFASLLHAVELAEIEVKPLDINCSAAHWSPEAEALRPGFSQVVSLDAQALEEIESIRQGLNYDSLRNFLERTDSDLVTGPHVEDLICAGAFDNFDSNRRALLSKCHRILPVLRPRLVKKDSVKIQNFFNEDLSPAIEDNAQVLDFTEADNAANNVQWIVEEERRALKCLLSVSQHHDEEEFLQSAQAVTTIPKKTRAGSVLSLLGPLAGIDPIGPKGTETFFAEIGATLIRVSRSIYDEVAEFASTGLPIIATGRFTETEGFSFLDIARIDTPKQAQYHCNDSSHLVLHPYSYEAARTKKILALLKAFPGNTDVSWPMGEEKPPRLVSKINQRQITWCPALIEQLQELLTEEEWEMRHNSSSDEIETPLRNVG